MKSIAIALFLLSAFTIQGQNEIWIRLVVDPASTQGSTVQTWVELLNPNARNILLGDQNYRLYYNSDVWSLIRSKSENLISHSGYSDLSIMDLIEHEDLIRTDSTLIDGSLGFLNFKIDLKDAKNGGLEMRPSDEWIRIASLTYKRVSKYGDPQFVWADLEETAHLATAFNEITEWISPSLSSPLRVRTSVMHMPDKKIELSSMAELRPNPMIDLLTVSIDTELTNDAEIRFTNMDGHVYLSQKLNVGEKCWRWSDLDIQSGVSIVEIVDNSSGQILFADRLIKIK